MEFRTIVTIPKADFEIPPCEEMLFVGSCFADNIGQRFKEEKFRVTVNPFGVMYNPISIFHTIEKLPEDTMFNVAILTLGTNHIYVLKETNEVVDNCAKRPQSLFREEVLSVDECAEYLSKCVSMLRLRNPNVRIIFTVSPIRYAKYGFHESALSKSTLLLAIDQVVKSSSVEKFPIDYFPAYEIINDELRDYRFYQEDMLHPSQQAVEYIWQRFGEVYFGEQTKKFLQEWKPIKKALAHRPFNPQSEEYRLFLENTQHLICKLAQKYPTLLCET